MIHGADISEFQSGDFSGLDFVMIRSSFGTERADYKYAEFRDYARSRGIARGFYHYAYPQYTPSPEAEAEYFVSVVAPLQAGEVLALDFEEAYSDPVGWSLRFLNRVEALTGVKPLIYINQSLMNGHSWTPVIDGDFGLWLADWDGQADGPGVDTPWPSVAMRQYTDAGSVIGLAGHVDLDVFYVPDVATFERYGLAAPLPPVDQPLSSDPVTVESPPTSPAQPEPLPPEIPSPSPVITPDPTPTLPPSQGQNEIVKVISMIEKLKSRKLWLTVIAAVGFYLNHDIPAALTVVLGYLGVQGAQDTSTAIITLLKQTKV